MNGMPYAIATTATSVANVSSVPTWRASPSLCYPTTTVVSWHEARRQSYWASRPAHHSTNCDSSYRESGLRRSRQTMNFMAK